MKIRALLVAMSVATVLTGCQNMDSNGLLSHQERKLSGLQFE